MKTSHEKRYHSKTKEMGNGASGLGGGPPGEKKKDDAPKKKKYVV